VKIRRAAQSNYAPMELALNSIQRRTVFLGLGAVLSLIYISVSAKLFVASVFSQRAELASLRRAVRLDPENAAYRDHLGRYYAFVARDPAASIAHYRAAVELNPHSARFWFDLASAYQVLGDTQQQSWALEHAITVDPTTPDVAWEAANFYLVQGDNEKALHEFRAVMANDPSLAGLAIQYCWRVEPDVDALLRNVVPAKADADIAFLSLLMSKKETAATAKVWAAMVASGESFDLQVVNDYFKFLIHQKDVDQAQIVWQQATSRFGLTSYLPTDNNLIVNGDFHLDILNGGFDWHYEKQQSVSLTLDPSEFHSGRRSLLITFDGPGVTDAGIQQFIAVQPNTAYDFSAYYKSGEMEGAGAPHIVVEDAYSHAALYDSDELKQNGFWKSAGGEFTTGNECKLLLLQVKRIPEGSPIRGKLWIDDFRLVARQQQS
jgi:tetratricopeptide (TPR) repeat protein